MDEQVPSNPSAGLNSPQLSKSGKPRKRAISTIEQLKALITQFEDDSKEPNRRNSRIMAKYNAEKPYRDSELDAQQLSWRSNFSTQPLASLIDRISPRFWRAVSSARYLTSAKLPDSVPDAAKKSEVFRSEFTKLVRQREGFKDLVDEIAQEDALFGFTAAGYVDPYAWFPRHFRQDMFFVYSGTKQHAKKCELVFLKENLLVHELYELIEDESAAETGGWDVKEVYDSINKAMPEEVAKNIDSDARRFEDIARESTLFSSFSRSSKVIQLYHAFVREVTGKVSHYIVDGRSWKYLFEAEDRFDSMSDVVTFFSFQQANGLLKASKGVGRTVYALAGIIDRARNEIVDRFQLSGKMLFQGNEKDLPKFRMSIIGGAMLVSKAFDVSPAKLDGSVEPFLQLDAWVARLMDELAGNVSPAQVSNQIQGERPTNGQINWLADLNNEIKDNKIERFLSHFITLCSSMQRRAYSTQCDEQDARDSRARCLRIMSEEELEYLRTQPAASAVEDLTEMERQQEIMICDSLKGDPLIDQVKIRKRSLTSAVDAEFAEDVVLPENDPTQDAEQRRSQMMENELLLKGRQVPISPRDLDLAHIEEAIPEIENLAGQVATNLDALEIIKGFAEHIRQHLDSAKQKGIDKAQLQPYEQQLAKIDAGIQTFADQAAAQAGVPPAAPAQ